MRFSSPSFIFHCKLKHLAGAKRIPASTRTIAVTIVQDGESFIPSFVEHYFKLGVEHLVIVDNNSMDRTVDFVPESDQITLLQFKEPIYRKGNELKLKQFLTQHYGRNRWCFCVDIDEHFSYPYVEQIPLAQFLDYLERYQYTAVIAQMLDLVSCKNQQVDFEPESIKDVRFFNLDQIQKFDYKEFNYGGISNASNTISNNEIGYYRGGIRKQLFNISPVLTKHPLLYMDGKISMNHAHGVQNARCADLSAVLLHYKFSGRWSERVRKYVNNKYGALSEYKECLETKNKNELQFEELHSSFDLTVLLDKHFLHVSKNYQDYCDAFS